MTHLIRCATTCEWSCRVVKCFFVFLQDSKHLNYLTSGQALADFAVLIQNLKTTLPGVQHSPVIAVGGSYGGMLAAWFRMKYPNVVVGYDDKMILLFRFNRHRHDMLSRICFSASKPRSCMCSWCHSEETLLVLPFQSSGFLCPDMAVPWSGAMRRLLQDSNAGLCQKWD